MEIDFEAYTPTRRVGEKEMLNYGMGLWWVAFNETLLILREFEIPHYSLSVELYEM